MESIKKIYRKGYGPSSSHTMAPYRAAVQFRTDHPDAASIRVTLYGSLAATGRGHHTDKALTDGSAPLPVEIVWKPDVVLPFHTNGMHFEALDAQGTATAEWTIYSVGGGALANETVREESVCVYDKSTLAEILPYIEHEGMTYWEYVQQCEGDSIWPYLQEMWEVMQSTIREGLQAEGVIPGGLHLRSKARQYYVRASSYKPSLQSRALVIAYALATSERNAAGGHIVTAPTCGSSGVLPAVLYHLKKAHDFSDTEILRAMATAGLFANVIKHNASLSGAEVGLCHGCRGGQPAVWRQSPADRVCRRDGYGAQLGVDMRPHVRPGADPLHRAQRHGCAASIGHQHLRHDERRQAHHLVRQGGAHHETHGPRPAQPLQRDLHGWPCSGGIVN